MDALNKLDEFISINKLLDYNDALLLGVSGGMDSMFLLNYLCVRKYKVIVAHCNFGLREEESEGDEQLVKSYCKHHEVTCHVKKFDTLLWSNSKGISIQMAARELRYQWFNELCVTFHYTKVLTAHHQSDNTETILLNIIRGTGLKGLEGMKVRTNNLIRPMLCLSKTDIELAAKALKINYREDSSNLTVKYHRNRLRLNVLPQLTKINPSFETTLKNNAEIMTQANEFISYYLHGLQEKLIKKGNEQRSINIKALLECPNPLFVLFQILSSYGFNYSVVKNIYRSLEGLSGKQFLSDTHQVIINRGELILQTKKHREYERIEVNSDTDTINVQDQIWRFMAESIPFKQTINKMEASFDYTKIKFPLVIRPWQLGDKMVPLGMKGHKKVSDILIDKKVAINEKSKISVVISNNDIIWLSGQTLNENYKVQPQSEKIFTIRIED
jgi:tRNA(Ile)-lysidine synthase